MRRVVWFVGGVATGAAGAGYAKRKVVTAANRMRPSNVAQSASAAVRRRHRRFVGALQEGVVAARRREEELRAERDGQLIHLHDHLADGDEVLVDGEVVEPGRVILLRRSDQSSTR